jgi:hypothetical protein
MGVLSLVVMQEGGHFPIRYLFIFMITSAAFDISIGGMSLVKVTGIIFLTGMYLFIQVMNKEYDLKH